MKIFNVQPITISRYEFNEEYLEKSHTSSGYTGGFAFEAKRVDGLITMQVSFEIRYTAGSASDIEVIRPPHEITSDGRLRYIIEFESHAGGDDYIVLAYESSCRFNFESEGFDADVDSIVNFLKDYEAHTRFFFKQYVFINSLQEKIDRTRTWHTLENDANTAIENLRANGLYEL